MSGHGHRAKGDEPASRTFYNGMTRRMEVEGSEGRKAGSKVPPAKRKRKRRK